MERAGLGIHGALRGICGGGRCALLFTSQPLRSDQVSVFFYLSKALWSLTKILQAFRKINAVTVPHLVGVPKNEEEDAKKGL